MAGHIGAVSWAETAEALDARYRQAPAVAERKRLQVLALVRRGNTARAAAHQAGVGERTVVRWLDWYRAGGLAAVLRRQPGHAARGRRCWLTAAQQAELLTEAGAGRFRTYGEARTWLGERFQARYTYDGAHTLLTRLGIHPKVPRPVAEKADPAAQVAWKKGG
jgi:transposase